MLSFLQAKGFRAEVTEGIDLENAVLLTGQRVTVGSAPTDTLRLGAADIVPGHLTFERRSDGKGWDYFTSDRGVTLVDKGNPRTGQVRAGMWIRLGRETRIDLGRAVLPAEAQNDTAGDAPATIPMPVALGVLAVIAVAGLVFSGGLQRGGGIPLRTTGWVTGATELSPAVETCLAQASALLHAVPPSDPANHFWQASTLRRTDPSAAASAERELTTRIREILASAHLLYSENKPLEASQTLRRLEYVLPVTDTDCPILQASRFDLALLEVRGTR